MRRLGLRRTEVLLLLFLVAGLLGAAWVILALTYPFAPYTPYAYNVQPEQACPDDTITVSADRAIEEPMFGSVGRIRVDSEWVEDRTGAVFPLGDAEIPSVAGGRREVTSPVLREAPPIPGTWRLRSRFEVKGSVFGFPRTQRFEASSATALTVLDKNTGCEENN